ncbi:MAG TPA: lamin tail domain-containing protein [Verrucomicrobiae bacterium]|nr:lamin tail domain-containing protein [Verrucomicrobiae bacterium]
MRSFVVLAMVASWVATCSVSAVEIFSTNSVWRFRKGTSEASSPTAAWRSASFNDAAAGFTDASAPFWYGDVRTGGTQLNDMLNGYISIFLRHPFIIGNAAEVSSLRLRAFVDDGFVAWINGVEVARTNVAAAQPTYQTAANNAVEPAPFVTYNLPIPSGYLTTGTNVLVVQVFNTSLGSTDFGFDALLDVTIVESPAIAPTITSITPPPGTLTELTNISVRFSEPVAGLTADDFLINGVPAATLTVVGNTYTFGFTQPVYGNVFITWRAAHGITDLATPPNAFNAAAPGATWQYNLVDLAPPAIANLFPPSGITVASLSQIEVTFSEPVLGVEAADLLINGQPTTNIFFAAGTYFFRFPSPPPGPVNVAWAVGHDITDTAASPNPFAGGAWSYTFEPGAPLPDLVINEILAGNVRTNGLKDENGELQDWIEIRNRGTNTINLDGWSLSDDPALPGLWTFPARTLPPNSYLIVFASGKDRRPPSGPLHTNFKLGNGGEDLLLFTPDSPRVLKHGFAPYPEQRNDFSYGFDPGDNLRYFATPTPGAANGISTIVGVCQPVHVNVNRGHFASPFDLTASCPTPGAQLRYTTNGSEPTANSPLLPASLRISNTTLFRAAAFKANYLPSEPATHSYFFNLNAAMRSLPVISIVTDPNHLYGTNGILGIQGGTYVTGPWTPVSPGDYHNPSKHGLAWERPTSVEWIRPEDNSGFQVECGIRVQGSDWQRPRLTPTSKFSFRLYFRKDYGPGKLEYPLFPLTPVQEFDQLVLRAGYNEQFNPFIRDEFTRRLSSDMGSIASHGNLAVVFVNGVAYASSPWYNPCERVHEEFFQAHLGGSEEWDVVGPSFAQSASSPGVVDGDRANFQSLVSYVNTSAVTVQSVYTNVARWLDLTNFADYCILNAFAATGDWPANNWRAGKDRSAAGPWRFVVWDAEWAMGIYGRSININSFTETGGGPDNSGLGSVSSSEIAQLYNRLRTVPEFRLLWADRIQKHFFNGGALTGANLTNRFMELRNALFPLMGEMDPALLIWARDRQAIFFSQMQPYGLTAYTNAPGFNQFGGRVPPGFNLVITNTVGTIYFTTDGSDPRTFFTGLVSPSAITYTNPVVLNSTVTIRARALNGGVWSALTEATFTVGSLGIPLRITEIMYNPPGGSLHEFIELQNISSAAVNLSGVYFDGISFQFPEGTILAGGARIVLGSNTDTNAWKAQYPGVNPFGWFNNNLNNAGERISLFDRYDNLITSVDYSDDGGWPTAADGGGRSLEIINPNGSPDEPANWQASSANDGTPGSANSMAPTPSVVLNEIMADNLGAVNNGGTFPDWIELRNNSANPVTLTGWSLTDDGNARKFVFPATSIPPNSYLTVWCDAVTNTTPGLHTGFSLGKDGDNVFLYDANTNRVDALSFGLQVGNQSIGRINGNWTLTTPTANAANIAAALAPAASLAINEWLANPAPGQPDWLELFNLSFTSPVALQGLYLTTSSNVHQLTSLAFLAPRGYLQLFADEAVGPDHLDFKLPASGETITLSDSAGSPIQTVVYPAQVEGVSRGRYPDGGASLYDFVGSVSPESTNYLANYNGAVINEVLARNNSVNVSGQSVDYVELFNPTGTPFSLAGMSLSVNSQQPGQFTFPVGTTLGGNTYLVIKCDGDSPLSTIPGSFNTGESLDGESGGVYLFNTAGQVVNFVEYGHQVRDLPIGLSGGQWRLLSSATPGALNSAAAILGANSALRINEWMPEPVNNDGDWFELYNTTNRPVDLSTISISDDPSLAGRGMFRPAPLSFIGPNGFVKWIADALAGNGRDHVNFGLNSLGDSLLLYSVVNNTNFTLIDSLGFGAHANGLSSGRLLDGQPNIFAFPGSASPAESNYRLHPSIVINEALMHTDPPLEDAIELRNTGASPVSINGWYLSNSRDNLRKYQITNTTPIPPGGYAVIYEYQFNNGTPNAFGLNSAYDDEIWLTATAGAVETGERATVTFGASLNSVSFGRIETSQGADFWPLTARTFGVDNPATLPQFRTGTGLSNAAPRIGPIVINEILYNPGGGANGTHEFIELRNNTASSVPLYDPAYPTNRWKLGGGIDFTFPAGVSLSNNASLLVVNFNPTDTAQLTAFRNRYGLSANIPVYGPFTGALGNDGDSVELYRPDTPQPPAAPDAGYVPYVIADLVRYTDDAPWPTGDADGGGLSLQRLALNLYGNEPLNWIEAAPTPGADNSTSAPDTDGDGIPDAAEDAMGLDRHNALDAGYDPDFDGMTNLQEYLAGTDHLNSESNLKLDGIVVNGNVTLSFEALANRTYSVLYSGSLINPTWTKLADIPAQSEAQQVYLVDPQAAATSRFYRLVTPALP